MQDSGVGMNRRGFLTRSMLAAGAMYGGLVVSRGLGQGVAASEKVRVGLVGCGGMGKGDLATFFLNPEVECPVVCDVDPKMIGEASKMVEEKRGRRPETAKDFRAVLDRKDVDCVLVATPDHWHALPTVLACQAGKDVYVEKPLATSIREGRAMITAAEKHQRVVQMGTQWRSGKHFAEAVAYVQSGKLGKVSLVRGWAYHDWLPACPKKPDGDVPAGVDYDFWLGPAPKHAFNPNRFHFNFRWFWDYAGGLMTDWGVHLINVMLWAMGPQPPKSVMSSGGNLNRDEAWETPDAQMAVYEFPDYMLVWEHKNGVGIGLNSRPWGMSFTGTDATLFLTDAGFEVLSERRKGGEEPVKFPGSGDARPAHVRNFLDCVKSRQQPVENLVVGHHVSTVAHLGNVAFRAGRKIYWDHERERIIGDKDADRLVGVQYRKPWKLPYYPAS
ncbi:MAG: Gfo/Idh/MocA family oxidoreductase [Verrucomicrobiales bacterium]|nr:Gfo/Idh/MocA family oxidoreductase [Verrucomicrobiales bacterium]